MSSQNIATPPFSNCPNFELGLNSVSAVSGLGSKVMLGPVTRLRPIFDSVGENEGGVNIKATARESATSFYPTHTEDFRQ